MKFLLKSENHVRKVYFCVERPLDLNLVDFGRPGSSVGELFGPYKEGDQPVVSRAKGGEPPRQGL